MVDVGVAEQDGVDVLGAKGKVAVAAAASARRPWNRPQSSSRVRPQASTRCIEPVTVRRGAQKVTVGSAGGFAFFGMGI